MGQTNILRIALLLLLNVDYAMDTHANHAEFLTFSDDPPYSDTYSGDQNY
jgi:hypothetical protein